MDGETFNEISRGTCKTDARNAQKTRERARSTNRSGYRKNGRWIISSRKSSHTKTPTEDRSCSRWLCESNKIASKADHQLLRRSKSIYYFEELSLEYNSGYHTPPSTFEISHLTSYSDYWKATSSWDSSSTRVRESESRLTLLTWRFPAKDQSCPSTI